MTVILLWIFISLLILGVAAKPLSEVFIKQVVTLLEEMKGLEGLESYDIPVTGMARKAGQLADMFNSFDLWFWWVGGLLFTPMLTYGILRITFVIHKVRKLRKKLESEERWESLMKKLESIGQVK